MSATLGATEPAFSKERDDQQRQLLTTRIDQQLRVQSITEVLGVVDLVGGTAWAAYVAPHWNEDRPLVATTVVGYGLLDVLGIASVFLPRDTRTSMLEEAIDLTPAIVGLSIAVDHNEYVIPRRTGAATAAGFFAAGGFTAINAFSGRTRYSTLRADRARLDDERDLTNAERSRIHHDFLRARGPISRRITGACLIVAGAVGMSPAFSNGYSSDQKAWAGILGSIQAADGLLMLPNSIIDGYESDLEQLNISVAISPTFIGIHGVFGG